VKVVKDRPSNSLCNILKVEFRGAKNLKLHASLSLGGMKALFYQQFWSIVDKVVISLASEIPNGGGNPSNINYIYQSRSKTRKSKMSGDFRHISLCNVVFKIVTKTKTVKIDYS